MKKGSAATAELRERFTRTDRAKANNGNEELYERRKDQSLRVCHFRSCSQIVPVFLCAVQSSVRKHIENAPRALLVAGSRILRDRPHVDFTLFGLILGLSPKSNA